MVFWGHFLVSAVKFLIYLGIIVSGCKLGAKLHDDKKAKEATE